MESGKLGEKLILMYLPYALARVEKGIDLTYDELHNYKKNSAEFFEYVKGHSLEQHFELLERHRKDAYFGQYVEKILTPNGKEWLERNFAIMKRVSEEKQ